MTARPSDVAGARIRQYRSERNWSAQELADRCKEAGAGELTASVIANIETGRRDKEGKRRRDVTIDEALTFAWVLGVPAVMIFLPLGAEDEVSITADVAIHPDLALQWLVGDEEPTSNSRQVASHVDSVVFRRAAQPIRLYRRLTDVQRALGRAESDVQWAEGAAQQPDQKRAAQERQDEALRQLAAILDEMVLNGVRPPAIWHKRYDQMRAAGMLVKPDSIERWDPGS